MRRRSLPLRKTRRGHRRRRLQSERLEPRLALTASVYITEFVADNEDGIQDQDGDRSDWVELFNAGDTSVSLAGWRLTDDPDDLDKWVFPERTLNAGAYLLVFATGKDRANPAEELHANFSLDKDGEYLALVSNDGQVVQSFGAAFPAQTGRASFGLPQAAVDDVLVTQGSITTALIPTAEDGNALGAAWLDPDFDDAAWTPGTLGVGFERQTGYEALIGADVNTVMFGLNSAAFIRVPFTMSTPGATQSLTLRIKYDDGFAAFLNGTPIASRNAPDPLQWDSGATAQHPDAAALVFEEIDVTECKGALRDGANVLAIYGLNAGPSSGDFLILPELVASRLEPLGNADERFFTTPTPGAANIGESFAGVVDDPSFSVERGFYFASQTVTLATATPDTQIRYTTDGSAPTESRGTIYTSPINIATTATIRASAFRADFAPSRVETHTYIFPESVIRQPVAPRGFPTTWDGFAADYQMDPDVVDSPAYRDEIVDALQSIPTMSIVTEQDGLFGPTNGIYIHSTAEGIAWERPISVELILPDGSSGFQEDAGLRIWGTGWRPHSASLKHAFQLKFKREYGKSKLDYPLFPDASVSEFDDIVLRAQGSKSWNDFRQPDIYQTQYIHDAWARDTARDMGKVEGHATFVHLYLNGLYWGLYNPVERTNEVFGEEYFGGEQSDYDVISRRAGIPNEATAGDLIAWNQMMAIANAGLSSPAQYAAIQQYLDIDDFIDYLLIQQYATNHDGPDNDGNNMRAMRRRDADGRFRFFVWDMEYTMWYPGELRNINMDFADTAGRLFTRLRQNPEFRLRFADHVQRHFFNGGALTPDAAAARWMARADEIHGAVVAESARWGDVRRGTPFTRDVEWTAELNRLMNEYFPARTAVLLGQYRDAGLFPAVDAPAFSQHGGEIPAGYELDIEAPAGAIYYTTDGSDPRQPGGAPAPGANMFTPNTVLVSPASAARAIVPVDDSLGTRWNGGDSRFSDDDWLAGTAAIGFDASTVPASVAVPLRNATADFSQVGFPVAATIDGSTTGAGWGLSQPVDYQGPVSIAATAVFETASDLGYEPGTLLAFTLTHDALAQHNLGRFRLSITTDDRTAFADGLSNHGDVTAHWIDLVPRSAVSSGGSAMTIKPDGSILVSGGTNQRDTYTVTAITPLTGITGMRLQAINDATLPFRGGPGRSNTGNAVLTEFSVRAAPSTLSHLVDAGLAASLQSDMLDQNASAYVRIPFDVAAGAEFDRLMLDMQYADGFVAYLNGHEIARRAAPDDLHFDSAATSPRAGRLAMTEEAIDVSGARQYLRSGANVLAIHALNDAPTGNEFLIRPTLVGENDAHALLVQSATVKARTLVGSAWSSLAEAEFVAPTPLRVTEIMYHPRDAATGEPFANDDYEFIELANISGGTIDLAGVRFTAGIDFDFTDSPVTRLAAGERVVIANHLDAFAARYGTGYLMAGVFTGRLDNAGEQLTLTAADGATILDFRYDDGWYPSTDGAGRSLVIVDPLAAPERWNEAAAWRASSRIDGSPGLPEPSGVPGDTDADFDVDLDDLNQVRNHFGNRGLGDADGDRDVDLDDLNAVRNHFGASAASALIDVDLFNRRAVGPVEDKNVVVPRRASVAMDARGADAVFQLLMQESPAIAVPDWMQRTSLRARRGR